MAPMPAESTPIRQKQSAKQNLHERVPVCVPTVRVSLAKSVCVPAAGFFVYLMIGGTTTVRLMMTPLLFGRPPPPSSSERRPGGTLPCSHGPSS